MERHARNRSSNSEDRNSSIKADSGGAAALRDCGRKSLATGTQEARLCFPAHDPAATDRAASLSVTGAQMDPEAQKERKHFN